MEFKYFAVIGDKRDFRILKDKSFDTEEEANKFALDQMKNSSHPDLGPLSRHGVFKVSTDDMNVA